VAIAELMANRRLEPIGNSAGELRVTRESMMRLYKDIVMEHVIPTPLMVAQVKKGERQWHFNYDG
jgi:hypothetical protein